ncbi:MAG: tetratricopeptide repeat protein [Saprospiraceae bacterium]
MKFHTFLLLLLLLLLSSYQGAAQGYYTPTPGTMLAAHFQDGKAALLAKDYKAAIRHFKKTLEIKEDFLVVRRFIGQCHILLGQYPEAANEFLQVLKKDSLFSRLLYYELGDTYYKMGEPSIALSYFNNYQRLQDYDVSRFGLHGVEEQVDELLVLDKLQSTIRACQLTIDSVKFINITEIQHLGSAVNSPQNDYFPFLLITSKPFFHPLE